MVKKEQMPQKNTKYQLTNAQIVWKMLPKWILQHLLNEIKS